MGQILSLKINRNTDFKGEPSNMLVTAHLAELTQSVLVYLTQAPALSGAAHLDQQHVRQVRFVEKPKLRIIRCCLAACLYIK